MEGDEMSMDEEDLQTWIRVQVGKAELIPPTVLQKYYELHRLLEKRQNQSIQMLQLCRSLTACENIVTELYAGLGWDYEDSDSSEGNKPPGVTPPSSVCSENVSPPGGQTPHSPKTQNTSDDPKRPVIPGKKAVVVLRRLSRSELVKFVQTQNLSALQNGERDRESEEDSPVTDSITRKKRKLHHRNQKLKEGTGQRNRTDAVDKTGTSRPAGRSPESASRDVRKSSSSRVGLSTDAESSAKKQRRPETAKTAAPPSKPENAMKPAASAEKTLAGGEEKMKEQAANKSGVTSAGTKAPAKTPLEEPAPNMRVIARKTELQWKLGKIIELVTKGDGRVKYKINFDKKGKSLVSGHHIAYESRAKVDQLDIGTRVVVHRGEEYLPGILGEIPSRKNRMRFLVFTDDGAAVYVGLPLLHIVCRQLKDPLEDIQDDRHRSFIKQYLKEWPYPPQSRYKEGQVLKVERQGTMQNCEVLLVDSSLIKVVFQSDQHTEWIFRGSLRIENILKLRGWLLPKEGKDEK
ncbi:histone-lysine N-methyltransferase SETDB1-A isoform X2 [Oryzias melastigma]|uniref:histone-lysine N-methyltransferase SETDB1-A isoform X2 n=1 Tax=Oryzias melastigma TaxID=30732 RepID=UPI000CF7F1D3|nr:histone-lysine N-methyltransferase SETDB1-A isoform X2 [Oryzias melastigma]